MPKTKEGLSEADFKTFLDELICELNKGIYSPLLLSSKEDKLSLEQHDNIWFELTKRGFYPYDLDGTIT